MAITARVKVLPGEVCFSAPATKARNCSCNSFRPRDSRCLCKGILAPESGCNVILHEFAHQLDYEDGQADGVPLLGRDETYLKRKDRYATWRRIMGTEYERLRVQIQRGESTVMREYGTTNPAEFFAVATETFFGKPQEMQQILPELYDELKWYYRQDPAQWTRDIRLK